MIDQHKRFTLFDIPEDKIMVGCDVSIEAPATPIVEAPATAVAEAPTIPTEEESSNDPSSSPTFLQKLSSKFHKSNDKGGADVMALRGIYGVDFEGYALVTRRANNKRKSLLLGKNNKNTPKERFLVIKGAFCFVFKDELSPTAKYAIRLAYTNARIVPSFTEKTTVVLETASEGDLEFEFSLSEYADNFAALAKRMALQGETDKVKKRLGHTHHLLHESEWVRYAERIAIETPAPPNLRGRRLPKRNSNFSRAA